jgi:hypothetical protein
MASAELRITTVGNHVQSRWQRLGERGGSSVWSGCRQGRHSAADLGRLEETLAAIEEAARTYRELAAARPDAFQHGLANSLNTLALRLLVSYAAGMRYPDGGGLCTRSGSSSTSIPAPVPSGPTTHQASPTKRPALCLNLMRP